MPQEPIRIPYYFPPQRYIPRLGGLGGTSRPELESPASAGFHALSRAADLYMQLLEARDMKEERLKERADEFGEREKDRRQRAQEEENQQAFRRSQISEQEAERGERIDEAAANRLERGGAFLAPGAIPAARQAGVARQPIAPGTVDVTSPSGAAAYSGGALEGANRGQQALNADVLKAVTDMDKTGETQPIGAQGQYGFARQPSSELAARTRASITNSHAVDYKHSKWMDAKVRYVHNTVAELERTNPGMTDEEITSASDQAGKRFDVMFPEPGAEGPAKQPAGNAGVSAFFDWFVNKKKGQGGVR